MSDVQYLLRRSQTAARMPAGPRTVPIFFASLTELTLRQYHRLCMTIARAAHVRETDCVAGHVRLEVRRETGKEASRGQGKADASLQVSLLGHAPETIQDLERCPLS